MADNEHSDRSLYDHHRCSHDAIKGVVHDAACRCHASQYRDRLEASLRMASEEATQAARQLRESAS